MKLLKISNLHIWGLLQLVVSCTQVILVILLYANWILMNSISKLLEGTCWLLCHWHWFDMVDVASLLSAIWSGEYYCAFIYYCCNSVIKSICGIKRIPMMIFYKYQLTYLEVRGFSYLPVICGFSNACSLQAVWQAASMASSAPALLFTWVSHQGIYNNFVSYWVYILGGLYHVLGRMVTQGHPQMVLCYKNK